MKLSARCEKSHSVGEACPRSAPQKENQTLGVGAIEKERIYTTRSSRKQKPPLAKSERSKRVKSFEAYTISGAPR
jgi:hypothetical protein